MGGACYTWGIFFKLCFLGFIIICSNGAYKCCTVRKRGIRSGFFHAWILGIGALLADVIYMALIYLGVIHFLEKDIIKLFLWSFGAFVLIYTGIESFKKCESN